MKALINEALPFSVVTEDLARRLGAGIKPMTSTANGIPELARVVGRTASLKLCAGTLSQHMSLVVSKNVSAIVQIASADVVVGRDFSHQCAEMLRKVQKVPIAPVFMSKPTPGKSSLELAVLVRPLS